MTDQDQRPLSTLVAQGWEIVSYSTGPVTSSGAVSENFLLRRQKAHKLLSVRKKVLGSGYVVKEYDF